MSEEKEPDSRGEPRERVVSRTLHFPLSTRCFAPVSATKMTPHRHTGVVIDYSDKCTCLFKVSELSLEKPNQYCHTHTLNDMRSAFAFRVFSIPRALY
jgi:hypothetical protein